MDWKQFIASVVGSLAWPVALVSVVAIFHQQLANLLRQIKKIGAAGVNLELSEQVADVRNAGEAVEAEQSVQPPNVVALDPTLLGLVKSFPEAAFVQVFKELEGTLLQIRSRLPDDKPHRNLNEVVKALSDQKYITQSAVTLFQKLRDARNAAAHARGEEEMSPAEAIELITQVKLLQSLLVKAQSQLPALNARM